MKWYVCLLCSAASLVSGGYGGYLIAKKKLTAKHEREITSMKEAQQSHDKWLKEFYGVKEPKDANKEPKKVMDPGHIGPNTSAVKVDYNKIAKNYRGEDLTVPSSEAHPIKSIYQITEMEYNESSNAFETLYYYKGDGVLSDKDNNCINSYEHMIGSISMWGRNVGNKPIYIRNNAEEKDYEIVVIEGNWKDVASPDQLALHMNG